MLAAKESLREAERHSVRLHGHIKAVDRGATIISISSTGCAFRTTAQLQKGQPVEMTIIVSPQHLHVRGEVVWTTEDYRIDTFYAYGIKFYEPIDEAKLHEVLDHDAALSVQNGPLIQF